MKKNTVTHSQLNKYKDGKYLDKVFELTDLPKKILQGTALPVFIFQLINIISILLYADKEYRWFGYSLGILLALVMGLAVGLIRIYWIMREQTTTTFDGTLKITEDIITDIAQVEKQTKDGSEIDMPEVAQLFHSVFKLITVPYFASVVKAYVPIPFIGKLTAWLAKGVLNLVEKPFIKHIEKIEKKRRIRNNVDFETLTANMKSIVHEIHEKLSFIVSLCYKVVKIPLIAVVAIILITGSLLFIIARFLLV